MDLSRTVNRHGNDIIKLDFRVTELEKDKIENDERNKETSIQLNEVSSQIKSMITLFKVLGSIMGSIIIPFTFMLLSFMLERIGTLF